MDDDTAIRDLITRWADGVRTCDLDAVLADHHRDIVMFDVPPPHDGIRGFDAYRASWPPFFDYQRSGGSFDLLELDVTAGADVAFAYALLRCATPEQAAANPDSKLRLTIGLRKVGGRWSVMHEHHSFCLT